MSTTFGNARRLSQAFTMPQCPSTISEAAEGRGSELVKRSINTARGQRWIDGQAAAMHLS
jgi:hypothetical protein